MTRSTRRHSAVATFLIVLLALTLCAFGAGSCASRTPPTPPSTPSTPSSAAAPQGIAPSPPASPGPTPGGLPTHYNSDQFKRVDATQQQFNFVAMGDNRGSKQTFPAIIDRVNGENALFALDNGDLVDGGTVSNYRMFLGQIDASNKPFLTAIGNHEDEEGYQALFGSSYYDFTVGNNLFIVLDDSNARDIDSQQLAWLEGRLEAGQAYANRIVFMHVPLYDPHRQGEAVGHSLSDLASAHRLNDLFDAQHVTLLVTSHVHGYYEGTWGSTPYVLTGGAGAPLEGSDPAHDFYHYVVVNVSPRGVSHQVVKL